MDRRRLTRQLLMWSTAAVVVAAVILAVSAVALHHHGVRRFDAARDRFDERWGRIAVSRPAAGISELDNGARWLAAGGQAIIWTTDDQMLVNDLSGRSATGWTGQELARARQILVEQRHALGILTRSGDLEGFDLGLDGRPASHHQIDFLSLVKGLRLLTVKARVDWVDGRIDDSLQALRAVGRSADGLLETPVIMTLTVGSAAQRWAASAAKDVLRDPCLTVDVLDTLEDALPAESAVQNGTITVALAVAEIADEGLEYTGDYHDPSMGWSIPFWVASRYLFEDLFVAEILDRWGRYLELGQEPAARWPDDAANGIWGEPAWPPWLALTGTITPNLGATWVRVQSADTELQQVAAAIGLLRTEPGPLTPEACEAMPPGGPTALTGELLSCRFDPSRDEIVIDVPGAVAALARHSAPDSDSSRLEPVLLLSGSAAAGCGP